MSSFPQFWNPLWPWLQRWPPDGDVSTHFQILAEIFSRFLIPQWMAMLNTHMQIDNHKIWQTYVYQTQVNLGPDLWVRIPVRHWCLVPPDDQTNPNCATWWPNIQLINIQLINTSGAIWWSIVQLMQVVPSGGQICNWCKWRHLVAKFTTNASCAI